MVSDSHVSRTLLFKKGYPGIGLETHESPYLRGGSNDIILVGHTFSDEPGIYIEGKVRTMTRTVYITPIEHNMTDRLVSVWKIAFILMRMAPRSTSLLVWVALHLVLGAPDIPVYGCMYYSYAWIHYVSSSLAFCSLLRSRDATQLSSESALILGHRSGTRAV